MKITFQVYDVGSTSYKRINFLAEAGDDYTVGFIKPGSTVTTSVDIDDTVNTEVNETISAYNMEWSFAITDNNDSSNNTTLKIPIEFTDFTPSQTLVANIPASNIKWTDTSDSFTLEGFDAPFGVRTVGVEYPAASNIADISIPSVYTTYTISPLYIGTWTSTMTKALKYTHSTYGTSQDVSVFFERTKRSIVSQVVENDNGLCCMYTAIKKTNERYEAVECSNKTLADRYSADLDRLAHLFSLAQAAINCGKVSEVQGYVTEAKKIANTTTECTCGTADGSMVLDILGNVGSFVNPAASNVDGDVTVTQNGNTFITVNENPEGTFTLGHDTTSFNNFIVSSTAYSGLNSLISTNATNLSDYETSNDTNVGANALDIDDLEAYVGSSGASTVTDTFDHSNATNVTGILDDLDAAITTSNTSINALKTLSFRMNIAFPTENDGFVNSDGYNWDSSNGLEAEYIHESGNFPDVTTNYNRVQVMPNNTYAVYNVFISADTITASTNWTSQLTLNYANGTAGNAQWENMNSNNIRAMIINETVIPNSGNTSNLIWLTVAIYVRSSWGDFFFIPGSYWFTSNIDQFTTNDLSLNITIQSEDL